MNFQDYINDALDLVSAWDIPDECLADTVNDQARLMAGMDFDETWGMHSDSTSLY